MRGFPGGSDSKESACNEGDLGLISGWGSSPGEGHGYPLQYSCLENSMDKGALQRVHKEQDTTEQLTLSFSLLLIMTLCLINESYFVVIIYSNGERNKNNF